MWNGRTNPTYIRLNFRFADSSLSIDTSDKDMLEALKEQNFSLLVFYLRKSQMKHLTINALYQQRRSVINTPAIKEIIYTYLYFGDFQGALDYLKHNESSNKKVKPLEYLIKIHLADKTNGCADETVFSLVKEGLEYGYDRRFLSILRDYYLKNCGSDCLKNCLKEKFLQVQEIIELKYLEQLSYNEAKYLYKVMPKKHVFLKKMVQLNPFIKKRYFVEYANKEGIHKDDILRILSVRFRPWAAQVALYFGWITEDMRIATEIKFNPHPICINGQAKEQWRTSGKPVYYFHNKADNELKEDKVQTNGNSNELQSVEMLHLNKHIA